jgi:hypothetical protein
MTMMASPCLLQFGQVTWRLMPPSVGVVGCRGARRPDGTFAEALRAVPAFGAGSPAAVCPHGPGRTRGRLQVEVGLALVPLTGQPRGPHYALITTGSAALERERSAWAYA